MTSRVLGSIGRFLITTGVVVLLFVAYQLWGTGIQEAQAQDSLGNDFDELLIATDGADVAAGVEGSSTPSSSTTSSSEAPATTTAAENSTTVPEFGTIPVFDDALAEALYRDGGEAIARLTIPAIDVRKVVVEGVKVEDLRNGPGHYRATVMPGQQGNSGIAGHRTTYGAPFNRIDELAPGDEINVRTVQGFHTYRVMPAGDAFDGSLSANSGFTVPEGEEQLGHIIVAPDATWVLGDFGDDRITLTACHPKLSAAKRIIVAAELITEPVDAPPPPAGYGEADDIDLASEPVGDEEAAGVGASGDDSGAGSSGEGATRAASREVGGAPESVDRSLFTDEVSLDEGLNGDESALQPAILWGLAAMIVYTAFKQLALRWRFWPAFVLGIAPVVLLTAISFEHIDRYLPAG